MSKFYVGQPVVCVNGTPNPMALKVFPEIRWPVTGQHYRVRGISRHEVPYGNGNEMLTFVVLSGLHNVKIVWTDGDFSEAGFWEERFEAATDIDSLRSIGAHVGKFMGSDGPKVDRKVRRRKKENA